MKKILFIIVPLLLINIIGLSQSYNATLSIDTVDISNLSPGDEIIVPVRLKEKSGGLIIGFQFFIEFDHKKFQWKGSNENPESGIIDFNVNMKYNSSDWLFNDNGNQLVALWNDPKFKGVDMKIDSPFFKCVFVYLGGLSEGESSNFVWGRNFQQMEGRVVRGNTELYSDNVDLYKLILEDGLITNTNKEN